MGKKIKHGGKIKWKDIEFYIKYENQEGAKYHMAKWCGYLLYGKNYTGKNI